ncbi:hypothetical protein [Kitasatospora kifunensis]|uniref:Integral membrane protein n=1 Tax=Kitasatospora kifunensis TaxID=58351 RepID=A0A7W7R8C1_KITKI|nr:hypothetical protein [Kitasatospora kifunensis]MBB4927231.1 hypothetical protein [Kitasatospora kifunensis]
MPALPSTTRARSAALDLRVLRAAVFATLCVVLSGAGHVLASGCSVPVPALLLGWLGVGAFAVLQSGRERSLRAICGGLTTGQAALHTLFHLWPAGLGAHTGPPGPPGPPGSPGSVGPRSMAGLPMSGMRMPGMAASGMRMPDTAAPHTAASHLAAAAPHLAFWTHALVLGLSPTMLAAHLAAGLAAGWWLRRGEAALWRLVRLTGLVRLLRRAAGAAAAFAHDLALRSTLWSGLWRAVAPLPSGPWVARLDRDGERRRRRATLRLRHSVIRRGPPVAVFPV